MNPFVWHRFDPNHYVLEFDEALTAPAPPLELHVVHDCDTAASAAW